MKKLSKLVPIICIAVFVIIGIIIMIPDMVKKTPQETEEQTVETLDETACPPPWYNDLNGYEFVFLTEGDPTSEKLGYLVSEDETGDILAEAVYRRNDIISDKFNLSFSERKVPNLVEAVRAQARTGFYPDYDVIVGSAGDLAILAREGLLSDINSIEGLELTSGSWDVNSLQQLAVGDKLYFANCVFNVQELGSVVYFDKQKLYDYELESPYDCVKNNRWTLDTWSKMVKSISRDLNSDGKYTEGDSYGTVYKLNDMPAILSGVGLSVTTNSGGIVKLSSFESDKTETVYGKIKEVFSSINSWCIDDMDADKTYGYDNIQDYAYSLTCGGAHAFWYGGTREIERFSDMEDEFGIVPFPKADQKQEEYYSLYPSDCNLVAVPREVVDYDRLAFVLNELNYYSSFIVKPAWYDELLSRRYTRDDESERYLDLIEQIRVYDIGLIYNFGGIRENIVEQDPKNSDIKALYSERKNDIEADIKQFYTDFGINVVQ